MLPCFATEEKSYETVSQLVERFSVLYFDQMEDRLDLLTCALISLGWSRSDCRNEHLAHRMFLQIQRQDAEGTFMREGAEGEVANILSAMSQMGYRNEQLNKILYECLVGDEFGETGEIPGQYDLHTLYSILSSFARLCPDKTKYFTSFAPQLHNVLEEVYKGDQKHYEKNSQLVLMMVPDLTMYMNMWLILATFGSLQPGF